MLEFQNFTKKYSSSSVVAVRDFSLICPDRTCTCLLGENGAGKTTILKAVSASHFASEGKVLVEGIDAAIEPMEVKKIVGFVEESANYTNDFTVKEKILFHGMNFGLSGATLRSAFEKMVEQWELQSVLEKKCGEISKGFKQRLSFSLALISDPKVLVLDESMNGLDPSQIAKMRSLIKSLSKEKTLLLSTHLINEAEELSDSICVISRGKNVFFGTKEKMLSVAGEGNLESAFLKLTASVIEMPPVTSTGSVTETPVVSSTELGAVR